MKQELDPTNLKILKFLKPAFFIIADYTIKGPNVRRPGEPRCSGSRHSTSNGLHP